MRKYIAYYRVSTKRQGVSGLGLDAQRQSVKRFVHDRGAEIIDEFTEVESGTVDDRPVLKQAMDRASLYGVPLLIAKLDRLSRSAAFLMLLQESGVKFTCADAPDVCDMTIGVLALVARQEREATSRRTKDALAQAKARGVKLGGHRHNAPLLTDESRRKAAQTKHTKAMARAEKYRALVEDAVFNLGCYNSNRLAKILNEHGIPTPSGKMGTWRAGQAKRLADQLGLDLSAAKAEWLEKYPEGVTDIKDD